MHLVGLGSASKISMIFSASSGESLITFSILGTQTPIGCFSYPLIVGLIIDLDFCLNISGGESFKCSLISFVTCGYGTML